MRRINQQEMKNLLPREKGPTENKKKVRVSNIIEDLSCNVCDKSFAQDFNLNWHISKMH